MSAKIRYLFHEAIPAWHKRAYCRYYDGELWFADGTGKATGYKDLAAAKDVCAACPVRQACLEDALRQEGSTTAEGRHGIRGGLTPTERYNLRRQAARKRTSA